MSSAAQPAAAIGAASLPETKKVPGWRQLQRLIPYLGRYKGQVVLGLITLSLMGAFGALQPLTFGVIMDCLSGNARPLGQLNNSMPALAHWFALAYQPSSKRTLIIYCLAALVLTALKGVFLFWMRWVLIGISRDIEYDLRNDLLDRLLTMEPEYYVRNRTGELMSRATNDLNQVRMVLGPGIMYSATTLVTMVLAVILMLRLSPTLCLWVLIPVPFGALAVRYFGKLIHSFYEKIQASLATLSAKAQENLTGVRVVRAYAQEEAEIRGFEAPNREYVTYNLKLIGAWSMFMPGLTALIGLTFVFVLWFGGLQVMDHKISYGEFVAFYAYMVQLVFPMVALGFVTNIFQRGAASMGRLNYILDARPGIDDAQARPSSAKEQTIQGEIEFRHLNFTYPTKRQGAGADGNGHSAGQPVLQDINLCVPAGSTLAIVGPTGSGKSTLAALVARLWEAPAGTLFIDGRSIREWPLGDLRRAIGFVPQDTFLFSETLRQNIALGVDDIVDEKVVDSAEVASIAAEIADFPAKYETMVGERGITLSGGQKQRTSLARAILRDPRILVLDDALSSVDTDTEERILRRLKEVTRHRTTILISHRVSTVRHADQIVVLRDGRIVESGTHDELLARGGYYEDLYQKQLLEEELARE
jgi:ATP-binding cassette, subfamily B, multidrug efflux pump